MYMYMYICICITYTAFVIPGGMQQLLGQFPVYIEKKHCHVNEKVADVSFV